MPVLNYFLVVGSRSTLHSTVQQNITSGPFLERHSSKMRHRTSRNSKALTTYLNMSLKAKKENIARKLAKYKKKNRKLGIEQVRDEHGYVIREKDKASKYLGGYWGDKFAEAGIEEDLAKQFLDKFGRNFTPTSWVINFFIFMLILCGAKKSAPGPDKLPYNI